MATSYILHYENGQNPFEMRQRAITEFMKNNSAIHIDIDKADKIKEKADDIMKTGIKTKDAYHVACALEARCNYFLSTDDRLLKYHADEMILLDPIDFIKRLETDANE